MLHGAAEGGHIELAQWITAKGARDVKGALDIAQEYDKQDFIRQIQIQNPIEVA